jgi:hypothetical protein
MKNNKVTSFLQRQAETNRQWMVLGAVLFVSGLMAINVLGISWAATDNTAVNMNVSAGSLTMDNAPTAFNFSSGGGGATVTGNTGGTDPITVNDATGSGAGWSLTVYYNDNFQNAGATEIVINATDEIFVKSADADIENIGLATLTGVTAQANVNLNGTAVGNVGAIVNATAGNGQGQYNIHNINMNFTIPISAIADDYTTEMIFTVS